MMSKKIAFLLIIILNFSSCLEIATEAKNWIDAENKEEVAGNYHYLDDDRIKIFLPTTFKKYSSIEYEKVLDSIATKKQFELETKRLKSMRDMDGNFYIYFDEFTRSTYTINTIPYQPIYKRDAQYLLGIIRNSHEKLSYNTDLKFEKLAAKYNSTKKIQLFKVLHKVSNEKLNTTVFSSTYILSSKNKTVIIHLTTGTQVDFDVFLKKMIM